jgi:hypothetical protein
MKTTLLLCTLAGIGLGAACSAGGADGLSGPGAAGAGAANGAAAAAGAGGDILGSGAGGSGFLGSGFAGQNGGGPVQADASCSAVNQAAEKSSGKADIIWIIDNSGSMTQEAAAVQTNMNFFSSFMTQKGIDAHVVMISEAPSPGTNIFGIINPVNGICVDAPLGRAGACAATPAGDDTNLPNFMHWRVMVNSNDQLSVVESTFQGWRTMLRPDASKTFVVVTDDNAYPPPKGPSPQEFTAWVNQQPEFAGKPWRFSGVFCVPGQPVTANCAAVGDVYGVLVGQTQGVSAGMGNPDWTLIFNTLASAVVADAKPVDCEWGIPVPKDGQKLDPNKVNVQFRPTGSTKPEPIYGVNAPADCTAATGGWYYDDPAHPAKVRTCPSTCTKLQADLGVQVEVLFGCARIEVPR